MDVDYYYCSVHRLHPKGRTACWTSVLIGLELMSPRSNETSAWMVMFLNLTEMARLSNKNRSQRLGAGGRCQRSLPFKGVKGTMENN